MRWLLTRDVEEYAARVAPLLAARPVEGSVALTVLAQLREGVLEPAVLAWCEQDGQVVGAACRTAPYELLLAELPADAAAPLVDALLAAGLPVPGANGEREVAEAFAAHWCARTGGTARTTRVERLHRLVALEVPAVPGRSRLARTGDVARAVAWWQAFAREAGTHGHDAEQQVASRVQGELLRLWEDPSGAAVALAGRRPAAEGVARIGPVYTVPAARRHGYGAAVTAACTRDALDEGAGQVVLLTDLANATSNGVYARIGYRPVRDHAVVALLPSPPQA